MDESCHRPEWWDINQNIREEYSLPDYNAPRFLDGVFTYEIMDELEEEFNCDIKFMGVNTKYTDDWEVRIDGEHMFNIPRQFDQNGNIIYEISSSEFEKSFRSRMESGNE